MAMWIREAFERAKEKGTIGKCTGSKFGKGSCRQGTKAYNMAKTLRKMNSRRGE
jgi:hypothetical protein